MGGDVSNIARWVMARVEVLGGLCGASVNYGGVRGTGAAALQGVELAGYLAGLGPEATALAMAKYMGDEASLVKLRRAVGFWVDGVAMREGWYGKGSFRPALVHVAVNEVVSPSICKRCSGVGFLAARVCVKCNGSGHVCMSDRSVSESLQLPFESFRRKWRERYGRVLCLVQSFDADVQLAVSRQVCADMHIGF
ncbi:hypothetical protein [Methylomonas sp. CM2]|uniref:hypothetical protein n=1 Tax=Methylomonas sp. CM2 TaxID=3417647 RepID=UPI003CF3959A